jgi:hypothetical protein
MLMKTDAIYQGTKLPQDEPTRRVITGQYLAKNRLSDRARSRLAADLLDGRADLGPLTAKQVVALCRAKQARVDAARDPDRQNRLRQLKLQRTWESSDPDHRAEVFRVIGIENVWKTLLTAMS